MIEPREAAMALIRAQVSLYPLRTQRLSDVIGAAVEVFKRHRLDTRPGPMSTMVTGSEAEVFAALSEAFHVAAQHGDAVMVATVSNACPIEEGGCRA
jgi:uncharacterized protein YqgV (UPF0045/DUF77 family)